MCIVSYHSVKGKIPLYQALSDLLTLFLNEHTALDVICHSAVSFSLSALEAWEMQARNMKKGTGEGGGGGEDRQCHRELEEKK